MQIPKGNSSEKYVCLLYSGKKPYLWLMYIPVSLKSEKEHWNYNQAKNENIKKARVWTSTLTPSNTKRASETFISMLRLISSQIKQSKRSSVPYEKALINASRRDTHFNSHF